MKLFKRLFGSPTPKPKPLIKSPIKVTHVYMSNTSVQLDCPCCGHQIILNVPMSGKTDHIANDNKYEEGERNSINLNTEELNFAK